MINYILFSFPFLFAIIIAYIIIPRMTENEVKRFLSNYYEL
jgi:hypothetical protein